MEADRKRRIESLSSHFADKLEKKRRKLFQLHVELSDLEKASYSTKKSDLPTLNFNGLSGQPASPSPQCKALRLTSPNVGHSGKEACVLARIAQLQKEGRWHSAKKLPKLVVPARSKTHWDFVLEEMRWLCGVFQDEIKMKKAVSKKCSRMVQKHFTDKVLAVQRAEKAHEQNLRRIASNIAKEVRNFWSDIEKLFKFRIKSMVDDKRKRALDEHLNFIVDKTEKYSTLLAESLAESASLKTTPNVSDSEGGENDDDYMPDQNSDDDEGTIAKEEDAHEDDEIDMLKAESDIPVEELLKLYHPELYIESANVNNEDGCPGRVDPSNGQVSDIGQERQCNDERKVRKKKRFTSKTVAEDTDMNGLEAMVSGSEDKLSDVIEMATRFQPTGNTLDTTSVKTKVPFLLKHTIREYQHIGLDWLVSLNERKLNGILADEMGLGKTIQTIAFLAHLACEKHQWGPHLIVVPTSVMLNWEMELKKWAPAFKVLTYYGSQKERRLKRVGWTKPNAFHVCITSYKLVVQDHQSFRRKRWQYFILDEAQHIKNFKSQRWQMLLNFSSEGRLLLTGTPLQNQLMELWSLMHFLMPNVFESHRDFKEWFSNPLTGMVEGSSEYNEGLVQRLHKVLRPFLLRRLKNEVEKQLPKKYEHVIKCPLSKRQRSLYDDFMSRAKTKETLESGNLLSVINVLMQLRKVCNHPNLFEPRPTVTPFVLQSLDYSVPRLVCRALDYHPLKSIDLRTLPLLLSHQEAYLSAIATNRIELLTTPSSVFESCILRNEWPGEVKCPAGKLRLTVKYSVPSTTDRSKISLQTVINNNFWLRQSNDVTIRTSKGLFILPKASFCTHQEANTDAKENENHGGLEEVMDTDDYVRDIEAKDGDMLLHSKLRRSSVQESAVKRSGIFQSSIFASSKKKVQELPELTHKLADVRRQHFEVVYRTNERRSRACPLYGRDLIESATIDTTFKLELGRALLHDELVCSTKEHHFLHSMNGLVHSLSDVTARLTSFMSRFVIYVPACVAPYPFQSGNPIQDRGAEEMSQSLATQANDPLSLWAWRLSSQYLLQLPETRLIQYDCGKLQVLSGLLTGLKNEGHRVLLFTQMTRVLDVLESFMNFHGHTYLRLDGSTRVEQRQILMERFNNDLKYFCFILSTRSGGVGVNLTGADTVIFYDSDWNPTMDAQAQDRCHRIGQTRDVHIYRLVSERSVEENILKKANQKRLLGDIAIEGGNFTTAQLKKQTIRDLFQVGDSCEQDDAVVEEDIVEPLPQESYKKTVNVFESALATVEENTDVQAMKQASQEADAEEAEFNEDADKEDDKFGHLMKQLTAVERYALAQVDYHGQEYKNEMLASADAEIEAQRKEFDAKKLEEMAENLADLSSAAASNSNVTSDEEDDEHSYDDSDSGSEGHQGLPSPRTRSRGDVGINLWNLDESRA